MTPTKLMFAVAFPLRLNVMIAKTRGTITQNTAWHRDMGTWMGAPKSPSPKSHTCCTWVTAIVYRDLIEIGLM